MTTIGRLIRIGCAAFAEIFRVLCPGAHFCVSDIVATGPLPEPIRKAAALYVGCVAGALSRDEYLRLIEGAGFEAIDIVETTAIDLPEEVLASHLDDVAAFRNAGITLQSITVRAGKPA